MYKFLSLFLLLEQPPIYTTNRAVTEGGGRASLDFYAPHFQKNARQIDFFRSQTFPTHPGYSKTKCVLGTATTVQNFDNSKYM